MPKKITRTASIIVANEIRTGATKANPQGFVVGIPGMAQIGPTQSASNDATIDFTTGIDSTYNIYMIVGTNIVPVSDDVYFYCQVSEDAGSTWKTASSYNNSVFTHTLTNTNVTGASNRTAILLTTTTGTWKAGNATGESLSFVLYIHGPSSTVLYKNIGGACHYTAADGNIRSTIFNGQWKGDTGVIDGMRFLLQSGNITSGEFSLYGLAKT